MCDYLDLAVRRTHTVVSLCVVCVCAHFLPYGITGSSQHLVRPRRQTEEGRLTSTFYQSVPFPAQNATFSTFGCLILWYVYSRTALSLQ